MVDEPAGGGGAPEPPAPKTVALENFQAVVTAKANLETQVQTLKTQVQGLTERAATADTLASQLAAAQTKAEKAENRFAVYTDFSGAVGTTNTKVVDQFDAEYQGLPAEGRPTRKAWVETLRGKPEEAPEHLRPWLAPAGQPGVGPPKPPVPRVPGTPPTPPGAPSSISNEQVKAVREEAIRTGNWGPWKEMRKQFGGT